MRREQVKQPVASQARLVYRFVANYPMVADWVFYWRTRGTAWARRSPFAGAPERRLPGASAVKSVPPDSDHLYAGVEVTTMWKPTVLCRKFAEPWDLPTRAAALG